MQQAVILAGGKATRMRPYTDDRPKAMVEVGGMPIIDHQLAWLSTNGIKTAVVSCGYLADVVKDHVGDGSRHGIEIVYAVEEQPLGRGGGLKFGARHLPSPDGRWLGLNGDVITKFPIQEMAEKHQSLEATATVALAPYRTTWGIASLDGDHVVGFVQSPKLPYWINGGIYCCEPSLVDLLPDRGDHEESTFPELAKQRRLGAYFIEGYWRGIDTAKDIIEAAEELHKQ